jgi:hypothetical protein
MMPAPTISNLAPFGSHMNKLAPRQRTSVLICARRNVKRLPGSIVEGCRAKLARSRSTNCYRIPVAAPDPVQVAFCAWAGIAASNATAAVVANKYARIRSPPEISTQTGSLLRQC